MSGRLPVAVITAFAAALLWAGPAIAAEASPDPASPTVWLKGAFGRVSGGSLLEPATAAPDGRALDAWMRRAPLELTADVPLGEAATLSVVSRPLDTGEEHRLSDGAAGFFGPDRPGTHLLIATIDSPGVAATEHAWLVEVPDRSGGPELLWEIPGPVALLGPASGEVQGVPGHGCYAYLCVEAGLRPPAETIEPVRVDVGQAPRLRIDDGSAVIHWQGRLEPVGQPGVPEREAETTFVDDPSAAPVLVGLEPTSAGEWLLEVRVDYDRERGWQWFLFRLITE